MIEIEDIKVFRGKMRVTQGSNVIELEGDFLYKKEYDCWYHKGRSYMNSQCEVLEDFCKSCN